MIAGNPNFSAQNRPRTSGGGARGSKVPRGPHLFTVATQNSHHMRHLSQPSLHPPRCSQATHGENEAWQPGQHLSYERETRASDRRGDLPKVTGSWVVAEPRPEVEL